MITVPTGPDAGDKEEIIGGVVTDCVCVENVADTDLLESNVIEHEPVPEHAPLHPLNTYPEYGEADSVTCVPELKLFVQEEPMPYPQFTPPPETLPAPVTFVVRV